MCVYNTMYIHIYYILMSVYKRYNDSVQTTHDAAKPSAHLK